MRQEASLADAPSDIMVDIFSRLPIKTIISCKCVCKSWLNLLTSPEFVKCHLSTSKPSLVFSQCEYNNKIPSLSKATKKSLHSGLWNNGCRKNTYMLIQGSVDGLMFCLMISNRSYSYYIFNPATREYIELPRPQVRDFKCYPRCGFGVSKMNEQYKMVRISCDVEHNHLMCQVYTLGTRSWRTIPFAAPDVPPLKYCLCCQGAFLNGNLHWLARDFEGRYWIFCFDLETELFSAYSTPVQRFASDLIASANCLHLFEYGSYSEIFVWSMKEYGVYESWTKECVVSRIGHLDGQSYIVSQLINVFSNGDILVQLCSRGLLYYSSKSKTGRVMVISELPGLHLKFKLYRNAS